MGTRRKDLTGDSILFWPAGRYLILYRPIANDNIEIVAVTQGSRDIPTYLRRHS